jgi:hypothetical protein
LGILMRSFGIYFSALGFTKTKVLCLSKTL